MSQINRECYLRQHHILRQCRFHTQACKEFIQIFHTLAGFVQFVVSAGHQGSNEQELASMARIMGYGSWLHGIPSMLQPLTTLLNNSIPYISSIGELRITDAVHYVIRSFIEHTQI